MLPAQEAVEKARLEPLTARSEGTREAFLRGKVSLGWADETVIESCALYSGRSGAGKSFFLGGHTPCVCNAPGLFKALGL